MVLTVNTNVEAPKIEIAKLTFAVSKELGRLPVQKIDALIEHRRRDAGSVTDAPQGHFAGQLLENDGVLVGAGLLGDRVKPGWFDGKGGSTGPAAVSL